MILNFKEYKNFSMAGELINQDDLVSTLIYTFSIISATGSCYIIFRLRNKDNVA